MKTLVDDTLRQQTARLDFRFGCEHCAHFVPEDGRCAEGFPNGAHRAVDLQRTESLFFCKSFELI